MTPKQIKQRDLEMQNRAYNLALEQAAKVCDSEATCEGIAQKCAAAIRQMKVEK